MQAPSTDVILQRGGEMGALARRIDWTQTPLGPVAEWPQSLRIAAGIVLESHFPMYLAWGPEYIQLYNDGYRPILGSSKHPAAMGARAKETFAEIWQTIGPMFADVRRGVATGLKDWMLPLERNGYTEECFFTFSYSPIRDESGAVGGVHVTVMETTESVLEARRLRALKALSDQLAQAMTPQDICAAAMTVLQDHREDVPFALLYLYSREEQAARLVAATGLREGTLERAPLLPMLAEGEGWPLHTVLQSGRTETVTDLDARFGRLPGGTWPEATHTAVVVPIKGSERKQPFGMLVAGVSPRRALDQSYQDFFSRLADHVAAAMTRARAVESEQRRTDDARVIAEAERARLYNLFMQAPFPIAVVRGPKQTIELANSAVLKVWGKKPAIVGQALLTALPEIVAQPFIGYLNGVFDTGFAYEGKEELARLARGPDGELEDAFFNFVYSPLRSHEGELEGVLISGFEVTSQVLARRELEQALAEAARLNLELQQASDLFRTLVDNLPELAWSALPDGHIDYYNRRWYAYTGTTFAEMEGWGWTTVHDPTMLDEVTRRWQSSLARGERFEMEFPLRSADGMFCWFLTRVEPLRDARGRIVRWFGMNTNIHGQRESQKHTEALLAEVSEQARETEVALRTMQAARETAERRLEELERSRGSR